MPKITALNEITNPEPDDILAGVEDSDETTKYIKLSTLLKYIYPVGSLYYNATDDTNPVSLFGFGTWVAFATGRVPVGVDAADGDFDTGEKTIGEKTHTLTIAEMPAHRHYLATEADAGLGADFIAQSNNSGLFNTSIQTDATGGGGAHNNLQPSIAVYIWKRTA